MSLTRPHVSYKVGNGSNISLWFDPWIIQSPISNSGLGLHTTVQSISRHGSWCIPSSNYHDAVQFRTTFDHTRSINTLVDDQILWDNSSSKGIKAAVIWNTIRQRGIIVPWNKLVMHKLYVPRFSFISWLVCQKKLYTADVLHKFGMHVNPICVICKSSPETLEHLYFSCNVSFSILSKVFAFGGWQLLPTDVSSIPQTLLSTSGLKIQREIYKLCYYAVIYKL